MKGYLLVEKGIHRVTGI